MKSGFISIVISTRERRALLEEAMACIAVQDYDHFEVIVVFDEDTEESFRYFSEKSFSLPVRFLQGARRGMAACRNRGIAHSRGDIILVMDDDLMAAPSLLSAHAEMHRCYRKVIVKGNVQPAPGATVLCEMLSKENFSHRNGAKIDNYAMGSNFSVEKKYLLEAGVYNEGFNSYGWEGTELNWRLIRICGLHVRYCRDGLAWHKNPLDFRSASQNLFQSGRSMAFMLRLHPEVLLPERSKKMAAMFQKRLSDAVEYVPPSREKRDSMRGQLLEAEEKYRSEPTSRNRTRLLQIYTRQLKCAFAEGAWQALKGLDFPCAALTGDRGSSLIPFPLEWRASYYSFDGYGQSCRDYVSSLQELGCPVKISHLYVPPDLDLSQYAHGEHFSRKGRSIRPSALVNQCHPEQYIRKKGTVCIGYSPHETSLVPESWVQQADAMDELWVPSRFTREAFVRSGVHVPVHVIPHGVDPRVFSPRIPGECFISPSRCIFLGIGSFYLFRGFDILIAAYLREFSPDEGALLILRTSLPPRPGRVPWFVQEVVEAIASREAIERPSPVMILSQPLSTAGMADLINTADAVVSPARGEGFGLVALEAMACRKPVIATGFGGAMDFLTEENAYLLDYRKVPVEDTPNPLGLPTRSPHRGCWAEPDTRELQRLMRHIWSRNDDAARRAARARLDALSSWTSRHAALKIIRRLDEVI